MTKARFFSPLMVIFLISAMIFGIPYIVSELARVEANQAVVQAEVDKEVALIKAEQELEVANVLAKKTIVDAEASAQAISIKADAEALANERLSPTITGYLLDYAKYGR